MTMLGMQADMQCHYFPGYCSTRDINLNASCSIWPSNNVDRILINGHYYNGNLVSPSSDQYLAYRERLKQVILQHEAIFKNQVHELHRLYNKQRELMDEMKRSQFHGQHLRLETLSQIFSENSVDYSQKVCKVSALPWPNPDNSQSFVPRAENNLLHMNCGEQNIMQAGGSIVQTEGHRKEAELLEKYKKVGKKILDLERPAYEYIDSELEESLDVEMVPPEVPSYPVKNFVEDVQKKSVELSHGFQDAKLNQASFSMRTKCLADLNEPIKLEEESDDFQNVPGHMEIRCQDLPAIENSDFLFQPEKFIENKKTREDPQALQKAVQLDRKEDQQDCLHDNDEAGQSSSNLNSFPEKICTQTLRTLSEDDDTEQGHEISASHLLKLNNLKSQGKRKRLESYAGQHASASKHDSCELVPLDDIINSDSSSISCWRKHARDVPRAPVAVQALPCFNSSLCLGRSSSSRSHQIAEDSSFQEINLESEPDEYAIEDAGTQKHVKDSMDLKLIRNIDLNSMSPGCSSYVAANSTCFSDREEKCKESTHDVKLNKKLDLNCNSTPDSGEQPIAMDFVSLSRRDRKFSGSKFFVDLNSCTNEDESSPLPSLETEVPESPENKERSSARGESEENRLDMPCQLAIQENVNLLEDLVIVAAEALVSISSSEVQNCAATATLMPPRASRHDSLYWFAKLASSVVDDAESECGIVLSRKNPDHQDKYFSDGMDYFEAMTLQLEETKVEEYSHKTGIQKEARGSALLPRRGRTRMGRQQRKDFQSEILPSLASLSRCEVNEDLQAIEGLIEAAHCSSSARRTGRNGLTRGRRRRQSLTSSKAETSVCMLLEQQTGHSEFSIKERSMIDWGKITRRRRGQRCPANNPRLILSQV